MADATKSKGKTGKSTSLKKVDPKKVIITKPKMIYESFKKSSSVSSKSRSGQKVTKGGSSKSKRG